MNLKHLLPAATLALALAGCGQADSPIRILGAKQPTMGAACSGAASGLDLLAGDLDLAAGVPYVAQFSVESSLQPTTISVDGEEVSSGGNDFFGNRINFSYRLEPPVATLPATSLPVLFVLRAGSSDASFFIAPLITSDVLPLLQGAVGPAAGGATLFVTLNVSGKTASGVNLRSNEVTFPIFLRNSGGCVAGEQPNLTGGPCGGPGGQDSSPACVAPGGGGTTDAGA